jgi:uncharacterized cupin superfamily protein
VRNDQPRGLGRILELTVADRRQGQIAERTAPFPPLEAGFGDDALRPGAGIEPVQRLQPIHPCKSVTALLASLGVEEMVSERPRIDRGEAERTDPLLHLHDGEDTYAVVREAKLEGGVPQSEGWFVINARDGRWLRNEMGWYCGFEGKDEAAFTQLGINLNLLPPGEPMAIYHEEPGQEAFLVLRGECLLIVEGQERPLREWDFFHCPPQTKHVILGAGDEPSLVLAVGARKGNATYPFDETAARYGAGIKEPNASAKDAYAKFGELEEVPAPEL